MIEFGNFVSFSRLVPILHGSNWNIAYFSFQWPKSAFNDHVQIADFKPIFNTLWPWFPF